MQTTPVATANTVCCPLTDHGRLYDAMLKHGNYLFRVAFSILRHSEDAEDSVQAAYLSAWSGWSSFHGQSSVKTWLTSIVMNKSLTELQRKRRRTWMSIDDDPALMIEAEWQLSLAQKTPEQQAMRAQTTYRVKQQLARLPRQTRGIVTLRYLHELSAEEIARAHNASLGSVKGHLRRGCEALRKGMQRTPTAWPM
jgi:RNA polymerase sigma-70 factor (ECF subfamily)